MLETRRAATLPARRARHAEPGRSRSLPKQEEEDWQAGEKRPARPRKPGELTVEVRCTAHGYCLVSTACEGAGGGGRGDEVGVGCEQEHDLPGPHNRSTAASLRTTG